MKRDENLDAVKGLLIILMVAAHAGLCNPYRDFIYLFHMPVFFMMSGYFIKSERLRDVSGLFRFIKSRMLRLYVPFVFWGGLFLLLHNHFLRWNLYTSSEVCDLSLLGSGFCREWSCGEIFKNILRLLVMRGGADGMAGAFWFLRALFFGSVLYAVVEYVLYIVKGRILVWQTVCSMCCLLSVRYCYPDAIADTLKWLGGKQMMVGYALIHCGRILHVLSSRFPQATNRVGGIFLGIVAGVNLVGLSFVEHIELDRAEFSFVSGLIVSAFAGWFLCYAIARFIFMGGGGGGAVQ